MYAHRDYENAELEEESWSEEDDSSPSDDGQQVARFPLQNFCLINIDFVYFRLFSPSVCFCHFFCPLFPYNSVSKATKGHHEPDSYCFNLHVRDILDMDHSFLCAHFLVL
jgi:hypothetical protein